jgi:hypothetical protein
LHRRGFKNEDMQQYFDAQKRSEWVKLHQYIRSEEVLSIPMCFYISDTNLKSIYADTPTGNNDTIYIDVNANACLHKFNLATADLEAQSHNFE